LIIISLDPDPDPDSPKSPDPDSPKSPDPDSPKIPDPDPDSMNMDPKHRFLTGILLLWLIRFTKLKRL
jgi:hypothetical protein